ncbi:hypothetical protein JZ751_014176 [Albula glossodonta]|uniref:Uncharacterized protein n=1 Tax=Albula glossodonta TaxID=121402 RepID=A0A8T2P3I1_9TELE|nr:hypothetical protein JZ751_014176 [Albula glossodonta]
MPFVALGLAPKLHSSPLVRSHGCDWLQSSFSCLAQTLQQPPHPPGTRRTPGAQLGVSCAHEHWNGQEKEDTCGENVRKRKRLSAPVEYTLVSMRGWVAVCVDPVLQRCMGRVESVHKKHVETVTSNNFVLRHSSRGTRK